MLPLSTLIDLECEINIILCTQALKRAGYDVDYLMVDIRSGLGIIAYVFFPSAFMMLFYAPNAWHNTLLYQTDVHIAGL